jgi:phosphate transport system protein
VTHYEQNLQRDISRIKGKIVEMSGLAEKALESCLQALVAKDRQAAHLVILRDQYIDELEKEVDRLCLEFLVRQQPVASVLRFAYSTIKVNLELERVGDYAESIARQSLKLSTLEVAYPVERFTEIANRTIPMLRDAVKAFVDQDVELARKTIEVEEEVDGLKSSLNATLVGLFKENKIPFEALNALMMIARRFERVSDQARNICMETLYTCTGEYAKHQGTEAFRILFVDERNACRSLLAEAIANRLNSPRFVFASAGVEPKEPDSSTLELLRSKGLPVTGLASKGLAQVPNLEHYQIIIGLAKSAKKAFPQRPRKGVFIDWTIPDPSQMQGHPEQVKAAYEETFQYLEEHIKDLLSAIAGEKS